MDGPTNRRKERHTPENLLVGYTRDADLDALADELGDLPLALHLAGSYLHRYRHSVSPAAYRDDLRRVDVVHHPSLQSGGISPTGHEQHVARTFALSVERLDPDDPSDALALALLQRAACFAPGEPIPRSLFFLTIQAQKIETNIWRRLKKFVCLKYLVHPRSEDAVERLMALGLLIEISGGDIQVHRLLAAFIGREDGAISDVENAIITEAYHLLDF